jgi:hypothetical protein
MLAPPGDEVERVMHTPQAMAYPRVGRFTHGEVPHGRVLWRGLIDDVAQAECVEPASDQAEVVQDWATVRGWIGHTNRRGW